MPAYSPTPPRTPPPSLEANRAPPSCRHRRRCSSMTRPSPPPLLASSSGRQLHPRAHVMLPHEGRLRRPTPSLPKPHRTPATATTVVLIRSAISGYKRTPKGFASTHTTSTPLSRSHLAKLCPSPISISPLGHHGLRLGLEQIRAPSSPSGPPSHRSQPPPPHEALPALHLLWSKPQP